jgi:hypothetical protein
MLSLRSLVTGLVVAGAMALVPAAAQAQVVGVNNADIGYGKHVESRATQYTNGLLMLDSFSKNDNWWYGMRPRTLVVNVDSAGRAIWVSPVFNSATICGVMDPTCASQRREFFNAGYPAAVGQHTARLDIYHADNPNYINLRNSLIDAIKAGGDVAQAVKDVWYQLQKT